MIQEINKLAHEGNRNIKLLNFFFQNIIEYHDLLSAGACSNLMFSMSKLSYSDEVRYIIKENYIYLILHEKLMINK